MAALMFKIGLYIFGTSIKIAKFAIYYENNAFS